VQDRAAAGGDRVDAHHRRAHAHAGDFRIEGALVVAVIVGDVGRGAAHVEADDLVEAGELGRLDHADDAAGWAGEQRVLALEEGGVGQAARRHHEHQARGSLPLEGRVASRRLAGWGSLRLVRRHSGGAFCGYPLCRFRRRLPRKGGEDVVAGRFDATRPLRGYPSLKGEGRRRTQLLRHPAHIAAEDRREIGVDDGGVAAADQLDQRRDFVADGDLAETDGADDFGRPALLAGVLPRMHEDDGDGVDAVGTGRARGGLDGGFVERLLDRTVGADAPADLGDALVELLRKHDLLGEDVGPRLVGDPQRVAKALRDEEQDAVALAFQQRVGGDGGAHLDVADGAGGDRLALLQAEQVADALDGGVAIGAGILREQLARVEPAGRVAADDVGEGAAAVDPEVPPARAQE